MREKKMRTKKRIRKATRNHVSKRVKQK